MTREDAIEVIRKEYACDAISRDAAIEAVKQAIYNHDSAIMRLTELPSVTQSGKWIDGVHAMGYREGYKDAQKQKSGKWLKHSYARKCSECGSVTCWTDDEGTPIPDNYCPNCGVKMESEE